MWTDSGGSVHTASGHFGQTRIVALQKITGPETSEMTGFVAVDLDDASSADGIVRCAKKILLDGAWTMARSRTYSWALLERRISGAAGGINVLPPQREVGIAAFVDEVRPRVESGTLALDAGKGVADAELADLAVVDPRSPLRLMERPGGTLVDELTARGAAIAAAVALDGLSGRTVAIEGAGASGPALLAVLADMGASVVAVGTTEGTLADPGGLDAGAVTAAWVEHGDALPAQSGSELGPDAVLSIEADVLMCGSKMGLIDHEVAGSLGVSAVVPIGVAPITAKGLAVAGRRQVLVLPDFVTLSAPLHAFHAAAPLDADECVVVAESSVAELTAAALAHADGPYLGACAAAEEFLLSWRTELPFGRPLA